MKPKIQLSHLAFYTLFAGWIFMDSIDGRAISHGIKDETVKRCQVVDNQRKAFE